MADLLTDHLLPQHPYVTLHQSRSGSRPVIKESNVGVDVIVGYVQAGYSAEQIAADILPHLTLSQIYDALSYYEDHREMIDQLMQQQTPTLWRERLVQQLGKGNTRQLLGENE